jgi:hypothetical protein
VPEAKVEDIFKRVRLGVRRKTNGAQIPWESTSLEDDFYFLPPAQLKKLSEQEKERQFNEELAFWEKVKEANEPGPLVEYLQRYPSGEFSELAQLRLDTILSRQGEKRIEVASQAGNPFTQGFARADTNFKLGDFYTYRLSDLVTGVQRRILKGQITAVTDTEVIIDDGENVLDLMGNQKKSGDGYRRLMAEIEYKIVGRETISVPAGTFDCFKVEGSGEGGPVTSAKKSEVRATFWYAPERVRRYVVYEIVRRPPPQSPIPPTSNRYELVAFKQT